MKCPLCDERMREVERYGVTIDICPSCKGVWLDRGELEKVASMEERGDFDRDGDRQDRRYGDRDSDEDYPRGQRRRRRGSFLGDLMEGFGE